MRRVESMQKRIIVKVCLGLVLIVLLCLSAVIVNLASARTHTDDGQAGHANRPLTQGSDRQVKLTELRKQIACREKEQSGDVVKNIKNFKNLPAGQLPLVMNAFSRALGVGCEHCHVSDKWDSEDKPQKQIAREIMKMAGTINDSILRDIKNLQSIKPEISCSTCHRGQIIPDTALPAN